MGFNITKDAVSGVVKGFLSGASELISKFKADPTKVAEFNADLAKLELEAENKARESDIKMEEVMAKELETVNQTMREEAKSEHWMQWSWRPTVGFTFCAILINNYILVPYLKKYGAEVIEIPDTVFTAILVILGAASAGRGLEKWQKAK